MINKTKYFFIVLFLFSAQLLSEKSEILVSNENIVEIGDQVFILEDKTNKLSVEEVLLSDQFTESRLKVPNLGITSYSYWIKFKIKNLSNNEKLLLNLTHPIIDEVEFYSILPDGKYLVEKLGEYKPFSHRKHKNQNYIFDITIPQNETHTYLIKVKSGDQISLPLSLGTFEKIYNLLLINDFIFGIYAGLILVMFLYNLFIYITVRDQSYLYYVVYLLFVGLTQACEKGYSFRFLWPNLPWLAIQSIQWVPAIAGIALIGFAQNFLQIKHFSPKLNKVSYSLIAIYLVAIALSALKMFNISQNLVQLNALVLSVFLLITGIVIARRNYRPAKFFLLAWSFFLACICVFVLQSAFIIFPNTTFGSYILVIGSAIEVVLLSFALADRINILKKENEKMITEQNIILESKVKERTFQLETSNKELKETQTQLVSVEKMASLGQLTAGIAHEINNPINFVISNIKPLRRDVEELLQVLAKYGEITNDTDLKEKLKEIDALKQTLDTDYVIEEINLLLKGIDEGAFRTSEIVKGLQSFSRLDESDLKRVNIHEGIDATLILLNNNVVREKIQIIKDYDKALPQIECYPGKLNQVFMNIINNAIQALAAQKNKQIGEGKIIIQTRTEGNNVVISIKDNGIGIPEKIKSNIFEPFFTTKDVGSGTGLGLSIVFGIIQSHKGNIKVESEEGKGAEFIITLPIVHS